ncbi:MAG: Na+/H+ antiporter NhaA [Bacteroidota bacterium]|jgi:NhaA family Na+:H+ antiporter
MKSIFKPFVLFFNSHRNSGVVLLLCVAISLIISNSNLSETYHNLLHQSYTFSSFTIAPIHYWVNEVLMSFFFLLVGLEIKRELLEGELTSFKKSSLPIFAAFGGMLFPALFYLAFNYNSPTASGWGIPMATDIAFAVAIIAMLGKKVPVALKVFLTALAIVDDLGAILIIAVFYTQSIHWIYLLFAALTTIALIFLNKRGVNNIIGYLLLGIALWYFIYQSGIHATIAGVILAFCIPTNHSNQLSTLERLEKIITQPVTLFIMPLFALVNTNIIINTAAMNQLLSPVGLGISAGLVLGKVIGISLFATIAIKLGWSKIPTHCNYKHIIGAGFLGGIGFTMSIFMALLSFDDITLQTTSKLAVLLASIISGIIGFVILKTSQDSAQTNELTKVQLK